MSFRGFTIRMLFVASVTYCLVAFAGLGWAIYFALLPIIFFEMFRPRREPENQSKANSDE